MPLLARIFGIETEYGITCANTDLRNSDCTPLDAEAAAQVLFAPIVEAHGLDNTFLPNGARLYLDIGAHPEYATAECDSLHDLLENDRAGDLILAQMAEKANLSLQQKGIAGKIHLFKNNHDYAGNSFGSHENYLIRRRYDYRSKLETLIPFFVTRQILVGAGYLYLGRKNIRAAHFEISQRAIQTFDAVSNSSTRSRPMINMRDEPLGDAQLYRRMHVIVGDSNMSDTTAALKIAITQALLSVFESSGKLPELSLAYPIHAIRQVSADLSGKALLELTDGRHLTALEIQQAYYEQIYNFYEKTGWLAELDQLQSYAFDLWKRALEALENGRQESVATEIEWIAKRKLLEVYRNRLNCDYSDLRLARIDLAWHDITDGGLRDSLEMSGMLRNIVTLPQAQRARTIPPQTTRAKLRGDFIAAALDARRDFFADWQNLKLLNGDDTHNVLLKDPFAANNLQVLAMIDELETA